MFLHILLSLLIWTPIAGGVITLACDGGIESHKLCRFIALFFALLTLGLCWPLVSHFNPGDYQYQFVEDYNWVPMFHLRYALGVDGISLLFVVLTSFTNVIVILAAWGSIRYKVPQYLSIFLFATGMMNAVFCATDSILFYVFWEAGMVPVYLAIGMWGGQKRTYAAMKFFLFTFLGSIFMLVAIVYMYFKTGSFAIADFQNVNFSHTESQWIFWGLLVAFAVKVPMWPVHTWLPDAHTEAPAGGSVVLAALMLKLGGYGLLRFSMPIVPGVHANYQWLLIFLSLVAVIYVGFASIMQKDMKRLIAYSSISHMGIVTLGIFMIFVIINQTHSQTGAVLSVQGAIFQMISHGFSSGALFIGVGYIYDRYGSRLISDYSGVTKVMPIFAAFYLLFCMANVGLPGTSGFVGEAMVIWAALRANFWIAFLAGLTLLLAPAYTLWMYKRVFFGTLKEDLKGLKDINKMEILVFSLLALPIVIFGIFPNLILHLSHATSVQFVHEVMLKGQ